MLKKSLLDRWQVGVDLAVLSLAQHTIMDYGTFGLWAGLLAGGAILAPRGYTEHPALSPDLVWWTAANMSRVQLIDINRQPAAAARASGSDSSYNL